jgi:hypothetical protein
MLRLWVSTTWVPCLLLVLLCWLQPFAEARLFPLGKEPSPIPLVDVAESDQVWLLGGSDDFETGTDGDSFQPSFFPFESFRDLSIHVASLRKRPEYSPDLQFLQGAEDFSWAEESFELPHKEFSTLSETLLTSIASVLPEVDFQQGWSRLRSAVAQGWSAFSRRRLEK